MDLVSIVVPTKNEADSIYEVIDRCKHALTGYNYEIIVVDSSDDKTSIMAKDAGAKVVTLLENGVGAAMILGASIGKGEIIAFTDGDGSYQPEDLPILIDVVVNNQSDIVNGNRLNEKMEKDAMKRLNYFGNRFLTFIGNLLFNTRVEDSQSGMKVMRRSVYEKLNLKNRGFPIHSEICAKAGKLKLAFVEIPISYRKRKGKTKLSPLKIGGMIFFTMLRLKLFS